MSQVAEQIKNNGLQAGTRDLVRYSMQLAMLNRLLSQKLMTEKEHHKVKEQLKSDYGFIFA